MNQDVGINEEAFGHAIFLVADYPDRPSSMEQEDSRGSAASPACKLFPEAFFL
ncbi:MAG TPA: hypothetical protein VMN76_07220 [Acidobacteriota bacterium]|nr:hypothetical protein [Acidobacteriota bacterium]